MTNSEKAIMALIVLIATVAGGVMTWPIVEPMTLFGRAFVAANLLLLAIVLIVGERATR